MRMSLKDYPVSEKQQKREEKLVRDYSESRNRSGIVRLIGGEPNQDLFDYIPGQDDGNPPQGAQW